MFFLGLFLIAAGTLRADGDDVLDRLIRLPKMKGCLLYTSDAADEL